MITCLVYFAGLKTRDEQVLTKYLAYNERNPSVNIILKLEISKAFNVLFVFDIILTLNNYQRD